MEKLWTKENFECDRYCGECCKKFAVKVTKEEIKKIKKLGFREEEFLDETLVNKNRLLQKNKNGCFFLKKHKDGKYSCKIHKDRPKVCKQYPFFRKSEIKSCLPHKLYPSAFK